MMASNSVYTDSDDKGGMFSTPEMLAIFEEMTTEKTEESERNQDEGEENENKTLCIALPEPDADNITVLTNKLPNKPILPWNHYDSPWQELESEGTTASEDESSVERETVLEIKSEDESLSKNPEDSNQGEILP